MLRVQDETVRRFDAAMDAAMIGTPERGYYRANGSTASPGHCVCGEACFWKVMRRATGSGSDLVNVLMKRLLECILGPQRGLKADF